MELEPELTGELTPYLYILNTGKHMTKPPETPATMIILHYSNYKRRIMETNTVTSRAKPLENAELNGKAE